LEVGGDADQPQLVIEGHSAQADSLIIAQTDADTQVFNVDNDGNVLSQGIEDIDGPGTNWEITAAGAATFAGAITGDSLSTAASTTPTVGFDDSDDAGTADEGAIVVNAPTANDGDMSLQVNSGADSLVTIVKIDTTDAGVSCAQFGDIAGGNYWEVCEDSATLQGQGTYDVVLPAKYDTFEHCVPMASPTATEEWYTVWRAPTAITITEIYCEVTGGTSIDFDFEVDDGTPTGVNGSDITCTTSGTTDSTLAGDTGMAAGDRLDIDFGTEVGTNTQGSFCIVGTID
jgi:hypothetical protein